jgi:polysaccharide export outer membrane protein
VSIYDSPALPENFMISARWSIALMLAVAGFLTACALPQGAGQTRQILKGADSAEANFAVYPIARGAAATVAKWPGTGGGGSGISGWISRSRGPAGNVIEAGDKVDITIWDSGDGSLLSQPGQKVVSLTGLTVSGDGTVFLPYVNRVYIAKMGPDEARETIQAKMEPIIPAAQVLIGHTPGRKSTVDVVGGVAGPGSFPLPDRDFTVMGVIALAGGVPASINNPQVRVSRDGKLYGISMDKLLKDPKLDTTLRGGDKIYVESEERYFLSLGAAGHQAQVPFPTDRVTALDAMALIGGLNAQRANPKGILVLRDYAASAVRSDGNGPAKERVVFTIDLTTADGLFSAGEFAINNRDVVLVTESPVTTTQTVFGLIGGFLGVANSSQNVAN